ncbi:uncharacterized protein LACBIDRAFT_329414 [Laccaria bicolor S238N-H82]|uniref:Predicted protein n=1 Tax=Laccaria bicolor (strain S238N-H82 / ATCC MYA-4686) TaxID=486041 RepID=B0DHX9_LACBS|nr:uncharacterized protein LACBIDRAFT_329414 [Laccaria bicolor S238N-H82]EDR05911.1 predicted protein [Laccaria bicolor S238N-H82]|eukprot:XP_001883587.1 predicted protein [Laccaria bicolor S238N-H82]
MDRCDTEEESDSSGDDVDELEGEELVESLRKEIEHEMHLLQELELTPYEKISSVKITAKEWKRAEQSHGFRYNGQGERMQRRHQEMARKKAEKDKITRKSTPKVVEERAQGLECVDECKECKEHLQHVDEHEEHVASAKSTSSSVPQKDPDTSAVITDEVFTGYISNVEEDVDEEMERILQAGVEVRDAVDHAEIEGSGNASCTSNVTHENSEWEDVFEGPFRVPNPPPLKRQCHAVPIQVAWKRRRLEVALELKQALSAIEKLIVSWKKKVFDTGRNSLQEYRARVIQSHLHMVLHNGRKHIEVSERAAESQGFAANWGGRLVRRWVRKWVAKRELPESSCGAHGKVYSLLDDLAVRAKLRSYLRSNKWSVDPAKLTEFVKAKLIPTAAEKYICQVVDEEMPRGLKKYMEMELFPHVQYRKVGKGITLETALQQNDGKKKSWVLNSEHALKKKGVGRGIHVSGVICATKGYLTDAEQTMEYGKNYEGYWTGELFVKQLREKIIPAFERAHGPGYQALIVVDNSQGHSAYAEDALLVSWMNLHPGGKQAHMHAICFIRDGQSFDQPMIFPPNHSKFPDQPKVKRWLHENCDYTFQGLQDNLPKAMDVVALDTVRKWEH